MASPAATPTPDLCAEITARRDRRLSWRAKAYPRNQPIASDINPDDCLRRQVFEIVAWKDKPILDDPEIQARFEAGNAVENQAVQWLRADGFDVIHEQVPFELRHRETGATVLRGNIDGAIRWQGAKPKFEVKLVRPWVFGSIRSAEDFEADFWMRKYPAQMQAYLIGHDEPWGLFLITDGRGQWRPIPVELDLEFAERIWSYAESIVDAVARYKETGGLPPYTENQRECESCPFFGRTCNPEIKEPGAAMVSNGSLESMLGEWQKLQDIGKRWSKLDEEIKKALKDLRQDNERLLVGSFAVEWSARKRKEYTVPASTFYVPKITFLG